MGSRLPRIVLKARAVLAFQWLSEVRRFLMHRSTRRPTERPDRLRRVPQVPIRAAAATAFVVSGNMREPPRVSLAQGSSHKLSECGEEEQPLTYTAWASR